MKEIYGFTGGSLTLLYVHLQKEEKIKNVLIV